MKEGFKAHVVIVIMQWTLDSRTLGDSSGSLQKSRVFQSSLLKKKSLWKFPTKKDQLKKSTWLYESH